MSEDGSESQVPEVSSDDARLKARYDERLLWTYYVQCSGQLSRMLEIDDPAIPKSMRTLQTYAKKYEWKKRLHDQLAATTTQQVQTQVDATRKRVDRMQQLEDAVFELLIPKTLPDGTKEWQLPPQKFEATLDKVLKLVDRIELLSGGVTSRQEVRKVVEVNVNVVVKSFGLVLNELCREGALNMKVARQINDRFMARIGKLDVLLDTESPTPQIFNKVESPAED